MKARPSVNALPPRINARGAHFFGKFGGKSALWCLIAACGLVGDVLADEYPRDTLVRQATDSEVVDFVLTLPLQKQDELVQTLRDLYDPRSARYHRFISSAEFDAEYGPSDGAYSALKEFAERSGFTVTGKHAGRTLLDVRGSVALIHKVFNTRMQWRRSEKGALYLDRDIEPTLPSELALLGGGAAALRQKPLVTHVRVASPPMNPNAGSGPTGPATGDTASYEPSDIRTAYNLGAIQNGGEPVALFELSTATYSDAATYASQFGLHNPTLTQVTVDGGALDASGAVEVMLDIEMVMAVANPTSMYVYTGPNTAAGVLDTYAKIASDNLVGEVSTSWGACEPDEGLTSAEAENTQFTKMAAQGIAVFAASGDEYAYDCRTSVLAVDDPSSQPWVTGTGGTTLTTTSSQVYSSETVWYDAAPSGVGYNGHWGGGGGVSTFWPLPSYQTAFSPTDTQFSTQFRNVPDVAGNADPYTGYYLYCTTSSSCTGISGYSGGWIPNIGGTSAVAPQWAALWSLISKGLGQRAGFANPALYSIGKSAGYASAFHDVTTNSNGYYDAFSGYDNATGWGSYNGANLYAAVLQRKAALDLVPIISLVLQ